MNRTAKLLVVSAYSICVRSIKLKTTRTCWSRYGISVSTKTAAALGVVLSDEFNYVLIPRAISWKAYLYGDMPRSTPLAEIDPTNKGALINSALDGESGVNRY